MSPLWACPFFEVYLIFRESVSRVYRNSKLPVEHCSIVGSIVPVIFLTDVSYEEIHWISQTYWRWISCKVFSVAFVRIATVNSFSVPWDIFPVTWWKQQQQQQKHLKWNCPHDTLIMAMWENKLSNNFVVVFHRSSQLSLACKFSRYMHSPTGSSIYRGNPSQSWDIPWYCAEKFYKRVIF